MKAAVIGGPVSHSLSPAIFAYISQDQGRVVDYSKIEVATSELAELLHSKKIASEFLGFNVTLPLKEVTYQTLTHVSPAAKSTGAVNVVHFKDDLIFGHNTDVVGIEKTFSRANYHLAQKTVLLWGAGGSAKACAYVLGAGHAAVVFIYNRGERGQDLAHHFSAQCPQTKFISISSLDEITNHKIDLLINSTPLGMQGQDPGVSYFSQMNKLQFNPGALAFDLIYVPSQTDFLTMAENAGLKTIGGIGMLIDQALATWEIWVGPLKNEEGLHQRLKTLLKGMLSLRYQSSNLYLTGFMGVGKSTVALALANLTNRPLFDTDKTIETVSGKSIPQIFTEGGESQFRKLETEAVSSVSTNSKSIISLGGGALTRPENIEAIKKNGLLIYLKADAETLCRRITEQGLNRPLLQGLDPSAKLSTIQKLLTEREPTFEEAPIIIDTRDKSATDVCFEIIMKAGELL